MTSKFWPLVMWLSDWEDDNTPIYRPSWTHYNNPAVDLQPCSTYEAALRQAVSDCWPSNDALTNRELPSFIPAVIEQELPPDVSPKSKIAIRVKRIDTQEN